MSVLIDDDKANRRMDGEIGIQLHKLDEPMKIEARNIRHQSLRRLTLHRLTVAGWFPIKLNVSISTSMATIKEVADMAGVSVGTVSHVITGSWCRSASRASD